MGKVHLTIDQAENLDRVFVEQVVQSVRHAKSTNNEARIALSGGSVAERFLPALCQGGVEEKHLEVFFCDERAVPLTDERSNFFLASRLWFQPANLDSSRIHPLTADALPQGSDSDGALELAARNYEAKLRKRPGVPLDLVLLGVGPDGHIASLFPQAPTLVSPRWVEPVYDSPKPPAKRLTMTLAVLSQSSRIVIAAFGASKAPILRLALAPGCKLPLSRLLHLSPETQLLLDREAASELDDRFSSGTTFEL